jgi:biopolymer transport protein ExbD
VVIAPEFLAITHGEKMLDSIARDKEEYDYNTFYKQLLIRREESEIKDEIVVAVRDVIRFKYVVNVMDRCRDVGFKKVGLSSATKDPESL